MPTPPAKQFAVLNFRCTSELRARLDQIQSGCGLTLITIVETLLRDDLNMPPVYPGLAARIRKMAR